MRVFLNKAVEKIFSLQNNRKKKIKTVHVQQTHVLA